jgi:beta-lactamase regulating signal transducer with metallopeptidase domain
MSIDPVAVDWLGRGWLMLLAFSAAVLLVATLRRPCRRWFGTERAFQLWLLPLLAMLASQLPHPVTAPLHAMPSLIYVMTSAAFARPEDPVVSTALDVRLAVALLWPCGMAAVLLRASIAQRRYRQRLVGATPLAGAAARWPVLRASAVDIGPALVGAWHPRIVLPADFHVRYDVEERTLILAHEITHARRGDGWWCLCAQIVVAVCWFNPLAWWALAALRHDQELACDSAVLREHGASRRTYAHAMLKTQSATFALPVGCLWSPRHPVTERIAMLKLSSPTRQQGRRGVLFGVVLALGVTSVVYAASQPSGPASPAAPNAAHTKHEYQLDMAIEVAQQEGHRTHSQKITAALCAAPDINGVIKTHDLRVVESVTAQAGGKVRVDIRASAADSRAVVTSRLVGSLGEPLHGEGKTPDGARRYTFDVIPLAGCPDRSSPGQSAAVLTLVSQVAANLPARVVAVSVASKAGLILVNPELLDRRPISLDFEQVPAERAMQLIAGIDGKKAYFDGVRVRFGSQ